ncbi:MAG: endolytic transglycosylase MltG, partial [candidate division Zixibacteria bacterium]|nr:endolytic transglycosylase MltG [candidate division Zixibacteria bacterium]
GLSREEVIVLASIVEAEALRDDEKPRIASVYQNRLRKRMKLDADPTVIYGLGGLDRPLSRRDLKKDTPYNTYRKRGLPPTPINSPGLAAIKAVLQPETTEYLYFVADGTGYHRFSKTNAEHNRARYEIKQKRRTQTP